MNNENKISPKAIPIDEPTFQEYLKAGYKVYIGYDEGGSAIYHPSDTNTAYTCLHPEASVAEFIRLAMEDKNKNIEKLCRKSKKARIKNK